MTKTETKTLENGTLSLFRHEDGEAAGLEYEGSGGHNEAWTIRSCDEMVEAGTMKLYEPEEQELITPALIEKWFSEGNTDFEA